MAESRTMAEAARLVTAEELEKFPDDGYRYELVRGRVVRMSPPGFTHGRIAARIVALLSRYLEGRDLGIVAVEPGCKLESNPDTVRGPDVAFVRKERIPSPEPKGFWSGAPDVAFEVRSPDDRPGEIRAKVAEYLTHGVTAVVLVDPDKKTVVVSRRSRPSATLRGDDTVDLADVIIGFRCRAREIFE